MMRIVGVLWIWVLLWTDTCAQIRFLADQDTDEIQTHESAPAAVEICSHGFSLMDGGVPQSKQYLLLLIACNQGTLHLSGDLTSNLVDTMCLCVSSTDNPQQNRATATLSVYSGGSCIKLSGFLLGDSKEPDTVDSLQLLPISVLRLGVQKGTLRVNRRAAFAKGIYAVGNDGKNVGEAALAWTLPDLVDKSLVLRGGLEDLNSFLPAVEYCSPADQSSVAPDSLVMTLSTYDVGIDAKLKVSASLTISIEVLPKEDIGKPLVTAEKTTNDDKQPQESVLSSQFDTISQSAPQVGDSNLNAAGKIHTGVSQKLLIQLPTSYLHVWFNQSLVIDGIGFQGYTSNRINFTASCSKGTIQLLPKSSIKPIADVLRNSSSMLQISEQYSTLKDTLKNNYFTYAPSVSSRGFDRLELRIESLEDQATEVLPIEIEAPPKPPLLVLPMTPVNVTANETTTIKGVTMYIKQEDDLLQIPPAYGIRIKAQHGQLGLVADVAGLSLDRAAEVQFESGIENINAALEGLQYRAPAAPVPTEDVLLFLVYSIETISGQVSQEVFSELVIHVVEQETVLAPAFVLSNSLDFGPPRLQWEESGDTTSSVTNSSHGDDDSLNTLKEETITTTEDTNALIGKAVNLEESSDIPTDAENVDFYMGDETSNLHMYVHTETEPPKAVVNLSFPELKQSYRILVPEWARSLSVTKHQSLDLSKVFTVDEMLESRNPLMARVIVSSGFVRITVSNCGEVRDTVGADEYGMTQHIYAPDTACMNQALESLLLYRVRSVARVKLELFDGEGRLLANDSILIEALDPVAVEVVSEAHNPANISNVEQNSSTQTTMSSNRTRILPVMSRPVKPKLTTTFGLNVSANGIEMKMGESSSLGDILTANGIPEDPTWFRLRASVAFGSLFIPMSVCCVDIRQTKTNSETDVIGTEWGIRHALAAVEFQSGEELLRKEILRINISPYVSKLSTSDVSFEVPINLIDIHNSPAIADNTENTTVSRVLESEIGTSYNDALTEPEQTVDITPDELEDLLNPIETPSYAYLSSLLDDYLSEGQFQQYIPVEELQEESLIESLEEPSHQDRCDPNCAYENILAVNPADQINDVPLPRVQLESSLYHSLDDTAFEFAIVDSYHLTKSLLSVLQLQCLPVVCHEDTPTTLSGFSIRSVDSTKLSLSAIPMILIVSVTVSHGAVSLPKQNCINYFVGIQSAKCFSFAADANCINEVLKGATYIGEPNFSGTDQFRMRVELEQGARTPLDEVTVPIIVVEVNDAPYVITHSVYYDAEEDIPLVLQDLTLSDPDTKDAPLVVTVAAAYGQLALLNSKGIDVTTDTASGNTKQATKLVLTGSLKNLNAAISSVVYTSAKDWNSLQLRSDIAYTDMNGFDTITILSSDGLPTNSTSVTLLYIYVEPMPDLVEIHSPANAASSIYANDLPGTLRGDEDTWIETRNFEFSSVDDTARTTLLISLTVSHGTLVLPRTHGLTFLDGTINRKSGFKVKGTFANVNQCVAGLRYIPTKDYFGRDVLTIGASAVDEYTQQTTEVTSIDVAITIDPINDAPTWNIGSLATREIRQDQAISLADVSFRDVDTTGIDCNVEPCEMDLIVEARHGRVTLPQSNPVFTDNTATNQAEYLVLSGTVNELNTAISEMIFELESPEYYRAENLNHTDIYLQLTVDDRGTFGSGGPQISTTTISFSSVVWDHNELILSAPDGVLILDEDTTLVFDGNLKLVDPDSERAFQNLIELIIICSSGVFSLSSTSTGVQIVQNSTSDGVVLRGYFSQLNRALNGSSYTPVMNRYGPERISVSAMELRNLKKTEDADVAFISLFVSPVCDKPQWVNLKDANSPFMMNEDEYLLINSLTLSDLDLDDDQRESDVTITVKHGGVMLSVTQGLLIQSSVYSTTDDMLVTKHVLPGVEFSESRLFFKTLSFHGRISDVNAALMGMIYHPGLDYNSNGQPADEIELEASSACGSISDGNSSAVTLQIAVNPVNDAPILVSQHFQLIHPSYSRQELSLLAQEFFVEAAEDTPMQLEPTEVYDADFNILSGDVRLIVNISCIHCNITSQQLSRPIEKQTSDGLIIIKRNWSKNDGVQLVVHGSISSLNEGLMNQLIFQGTHNFNGRAFVVIEISDLVNYGLGGERHSVFVLGVQVNAINDLPQIYLPQYESTQPALKIDEGSSILIEGAPALSTLEAAVQQQMRSWNIMAVDLFASDSSTRLRSLHQFYGPESSTVSDLVSLNGGLIFSALDPELGQELWRSDGSAAGTLLLKDIFPGAGSSRPSHLTPFSKDSRIYFSAEGPHVSWRVKDIYQDACQSFRQSSFNTAVYFAVADQNVWDPEETYDCPVGFRWMSTSEAQSVFIGTNQFDGHVDEPLTYFDQCGWSGYKWGLQTRKYFRFSDSKLTGAYKHAGFRDSYRLDTGFQTDLFAGIVCYRELPTSPVAWGRQLWASDGTADGTKRVARISTEPRGSNPSHFVELNQRLYFQASSVDYGAELWSTDGTRSGTVLVADIEFGSRSSEPRFLSAFQSRIFFSANTQDYGRELWFSDGNRRFEYTGSEHATVGTGLLLDICPGSQSSSPQQFAVLSSSSGPAKLLFQADDCVHGPELWATDGTKSGTSLVLDIRQGAVGSHPTYLTSFVGKVFFQADDGVHGAEMWVTDGSAIGTTMLLDIAPGSTGSIPSYMTAFTSFGTTSPVLVFAAQAERDRRVEFWQSDGSTAGTSKIYLPSREVVQLNSDSLDLQVSAHSFVTISAKPGIFYYLGRETGQGIDFQHQSVAQTSTEQDIATHSRSITLRDVESIEQKRELTLSLNCSKGWLTLERECRDISLQLVANVHENAASALTVTGSLDDLNCALEKIVYRGKPQENGWDEIHVSLSQINQAVSSDPSTGSGAQDSSYSISKSMLIEIRAVNDPPSVTMPAVFYAPHRHWVPLTEIAIGDPDAGESRLFVSIAVLYGDLRVLLPSLTSADGLTILHPVAQEDTMHTLEFAATVDQTKAIFGALEYRCDDRRGCTSTQREYITIQVDDNGFNGAGGPQVTTKRAEIIVLEAAAG